MKEQDKPNTTETTFRDNEYMTYRIAICDDETSTCASVEQMIIQVFERLSLRVKTDVFYSGESLVEHLAQGKNYNFVFLDIELYELSGVGVSRYIREKQKDVMCQIVFISSKTSYAMELFQFQPLDFMIKPVCEEELDRVINKGLTIIGVMHDSFECHINSTIVRIPMSKILYFESEGRRIKLVTSDEELLFYDRMSRIMDELPSAFIRTHKSFIVNLNAIRQCRYDCVVLYDNREIPISRSYRESVRKLLMRKVNE